MTNKQLSVLVSAIFGAAVLVIAYLSISSSDECWTRACEDAKVERAVRQLRGY
jgi:hypothetical protein